MKELDQIFSFNNSEPLFLNFDGDANGIIDSFEFFSVLAIFSNSRIEDRIRFLFQIYDLNEDAVLEEVEIQFMLYTIITGICRVFKIDTEAPGEVDGVGHLAYEMLC